MKGVKKWENIKIFNFLSWYLVMSGKVEEWKTLGMNYYYFFYLVEKKNEMIENLDYINLLIPLLDKK